MGVAKEEEEDPYGGSTDEESDMETDGVCVCACVCVCVNHSVEVKGQRWLDLLCFQHMHGE